MGKMNGWLIALVVGAVLTLTGVIDLQAIANKIPTGGDDDGTTSCINDGTTVTVGPLQKRFSPTTSMSTVYSRVFLNGIDKGLMADQATFSANDGDKVVIYYGSNDTTYYSAEHTFEVPCAASIDSASLAGDLHKLLQIDTATGTNRLKIYNDENGNINSGSDIETVGAGGTIQSKMELQGTYQDGFSPYGNILLTVKYTTNQWDNIDITGNGVSSASTPTFRSSSSAASGWTLETWKVPGYTTNSKRDLTFVGAADGTNNPSANITIYIDDESYWRHTEGDVSSAGTSMHFGAEDDQNADKGYTTEVSRVYWID